MSEISEFPRARGKRGRAFYVQPFVLTQCITLPSHTRVRALVHVYMIEDAAMKDERGDDVPDNESNEWEVGRELMCSSHRDVFVVSQELRYLPMYVMYGARVYVRLGSLYVAIGRGTL